MTTKFYVDGEWVSLDELEDSWRKWKELNSLQMENHQLPVDDPIITIGRVLEYYNEMSLTMLRFRKAAEDLGEYAADLDDKLEDIKGWFNSLPVYTISHLCTVLVPFEDDTVAEERTLYTVLKEILEGEE